MIRSIGEPRSGDGELVGPSNRCRPDPFAWATQGSPSLALDLTMTAVTQLVEVHLCVAQRSQPAGPRLSFENPILL
jgi:hypothetical protein